MKMGSEKYRNRMSYKLIIIKGAPYNVVQNVDVNEHIANGTQCHCIDYTFKQDAQPTWNETTHSYEITAGEVESITMLNHTTHKQFVLKPDTWSVKMQLNKKTTRTYTYYQVPAVLAYGATGHNIQGRTLDNILVAQLGTSHKYGSTGYLYVMLSRVRTIENFFLLQKLSTNIKNYKPRTELEKAMKMFEAKAKKTYERIKDWLPQTLSKTSIPTTTPTTPTSRSQQSPQRNQQATSTPQQPAPQLTENPSTTAIPKPPTHAITIKEAAEYAKNYFNTKKIELLQVEAQGACGAICASIATAVHKNTHAAHCIINTDEHKIQRLSLRDNSKGYRQLISDHSQTKFDRDKGFFEELYFGMAHNSDEDKRNLVNEWIKGLTDNPNAYVDHLWLDLAADYMNADLCIYEFNWIQTNNTKVLNPREPIKRFQPYGRQLKNNGNVLRVMNITSAISTNTHFDLLLTQQENQSLINITHKSMPTRSRTFVTYDSNVATPALVRDREDVHEYDVNCDCYTCDQLNFS